MIKKLILFIVLVSICKFAAAYYEMPVGSGNEQTPYQIKNLSNLYWMTILLANNSDTYYELVNDIIIDDEDYIDNNNGFLPIGNSTNYFKGKFNGNGYFISNLYINRQENNVGLFGYADSSAEISNLLIVAAKISGLDNCGGLIGYCEGKISNVKIENSSISGNKYVGGIVGISKNDIINCYVNNTIVGDTYVGGISGKNLKNIINCTVNGTIRGDNYIGGSSGNNDYGCILSNYVMAYVMGKKYIGGIVGEGSAGSSIENCYFSGVIKGTNWVGGLCGYIEDAGVLEESYVLGTIDGNMYVGGLCGQIYNAHISNCFAAAAIKAKTNFGGICGDNLNSIISSTYFDNTIMSNSQNSLGIATNNAALKNQTTFFGWNFSDIWKIVETKSYPFFKHETGLKLFIENYGNYCQVTPQKNKYEAGDQVVVTVNTNAVVGFFGFEGLNNVTDTNYENQAFITMDNHKYLKILLLSEALFQVTASPTLNGELSPAGTTTRLYNESITYTAQPNPDYILDKFYVDGIETNATTETTFKFENITENHVISASFKHISDKLFVLNPVIDFGEVKLGNSQTNALVVSNGYADICTTLLGDIYAPFNATTTQVFIAAGNTEFFNIIFSALDYGYYTNVIKIYDYDAIVEVTLIARVLHEPLQITASPTFNGTISPSGITTVPYGSNIIYTAIPDTMYALDKFYVNDIETNAVVKNTFIFDCVTENYVISANFKFVESKLFLLNDVIDFGEVVFETEQTNALVVSNGYANICTAIVANVQAPFSITPSQIYVEINQTGIFDVAFSGMNVGYYTNVIKIYDEGFEHEATLLAYVLPEPNIFLGMLLLLLLKRKTCY